MTMQHQIHPDDERLAALAGGDPDVVADADLRAHVSACDRCRDLVDELATLRVTLAELPDLVPSRPLQLIPQVQEPRAAASGGWLRRLAAPVMAAGFGLVLVGAIGTSGVLNGTAGSPAQFQNVGRELATPSDLQAVPPGAESEDSGRALSGASSPSEHDSIHTESAATDDSTPGQAAPPGATGQAPLFSDTDQRLLWLVVLGLGVGLLIAGIYLRFRAPPRAS
jgi:hypothetical protein